MVEASPARSARVIRGLLALAFLVTLSGGCVVISNRTYRPAELERLPAPRRAPIESVDETGIEVVSWNLGYAGMGRASDFVADGGSQRRPLSRALVESNVTRIVRQVGQLDADLFLFQEVASPSWVNHQIDLLGALEAAVPSYAWIFGADLKTRWVPPPLRNVVGNAIFSRITIQSAERRALPLEPGFYFGVFRKGYRMHIVRLRDTESGPGWVVVNLHLAAFDENAEVRRRQLTAAVAFAREEYAKGARVVLGGDWNLVLSPTRFPHRTDEKHLFWVRPLPEDLIPAGWTWAVDPRVPTVRTAHRPYVAGDNYVTIIDGFLCSPNVRVEAVETLDLGFEFTDHHPVVARLRAAP